MSPSIHRHLGADEWTPSDTSTVQMNGPHNDTTSSGAEKAAGRFKLARDLKALASVKWDGCTEVR